VRPLPEPARRKEGRFGATSPGILGALPANASPAGISVVPRFEWFLPADGWAAACIGPNRSVLQCGYGSPL
jgi:hypothetical protein